MFDNWMKKQEAQAERNFPGHKERSTKYATWLIGIIAIAFSLAGILGGLAMLLTVPIFGILALLGTAIPITVARLCFDEKFRMRMEARQ